MAHSDAKINLDCRRDPCRRMAMRSFAFLLAAGVVAATSSILIRAADWQLGPVGSLGDPDRLEIIGGVQLERDLVLSALKGDVDVQLAAVPTAPLDDYLAMLRHRIGTLYECRGFPETGVEIFIDRIQNRIIVRINEGPRCYCDAIQVEGAERIPVGELRQRLGKPSHPADATIASFDQFDGRSACAGLTSKRTKLSARMPYGKKVNSPVSVRRAKTRTGFRLQIASPILGFPRRISRSKFGQTLPLRPPRSSSGLSRKVPDQSSGRFKLSGIK